MVYIGTTSNEGRAVYFDVHAAERCAHGVRVSGTIGDGQYEGEVLVELGALNEVTFADAWLGGCGFNEFIAHFDRAELQQDLLNSLRSLPLFGVRRDPPHGQESPRGAVFVAENGPLWRGVA